MKEQIIIFILGTGRSGTNWIGNILKNHPDIRVTMEKPSLFNLVTKIALYPNLRPKLFPILIKRYYKEYKFSFPKHYVDKSHPNIWLAETLANVFYNALFIGIKRNPYATISSMLKHEGVLSWVNNWEKYPIPNNFLGITNLNKSKYKDLTITEKCALRWKSHEDRLNFLKKFLKSRLLIIQYENLINNTEFELIRMQKFIKLEKPLPFPHIKVNCLNKWKKDLSISQLIQIQRITGVKP